MTIAISRATTSMPIQQPTGEAPAAAPVPAPGPMMPIAAPNAVSNPGPMDGLVRPASAGALKATCPPPEKLSQRLLRDPVFRRALGDARRAVRNEITSANERGGLLYNSDRANRPIGSVLRKTGGLLRRESYEHTRPAPRVEEGLEFRGDGFVGGLRPIQDADAIVIGLPPLDGPEAMERVSEHLKWLAKETGAPVFFFFTNPGQPGLFLIDHPADPIEISGTGGPQ